MEAIVLSPLRSQLSASCLCPPRNYSRASVQHAQFLKLPSSHHGGAWFGSSKSSCVIRKLRWSHEQEGSYGGGGGACRCSASADSTFYSVLGVDKGTSLLEIKAAYRQMARKYHPDVCPVSLRDECTQKFLEVQNAYEVLSDPELKADYDYHLLHPLFAKAFEMGVGDSRGRPPRRARGNNGVSEAWKMRWEAQLTQLTRLRDRDTRGPVEKTWGERMRQAQGTR